MILTYQAIIIMMKQMYATVFWLLLIINCTLDVTGSVVQISRCMSLIMYAYSKGPNELLGNNVIHAWIATCSCNE